MSSVDRKYFPLTNAPLMKSRLLKSLSKQAAPARQQTFHQLSREEFARVKQQHGYGVYSYALGMNRANARRIARRRARAAMRGVNVAAV